MVIAAPPGSHAHPRSGPIRAALARAALALLGWRLDVTLPAGPKGIIIVYPHTSNWDFPVGYLAKLAIRLPLRWAGKDSLFAGPFGALFRWMGGIPVNRRERTGFIEKLTREFAEREWMWLALAPEGTRKHTDHLKSGFWHLALAAGVPVGLAYIDWGAKVIGLERYVEMTGDEARDLAALRAAYAGKRGLHPGQESELRFLPR
jgi:1-acyl-sn-glycerol-3-phosphate acyltransferase